MEPLLSPSSISTTPVLSQQLEREGTKTTPPTGATLLIEEERSAIAQLESPCVAGQAAQCPFWRVFSSTFLTIFLAEIGDKTQVSTLLMSAEFHKPWIVFLGAGTALVATTLIGVGVGQWLSSRLSARTLDIAAGIMLALISASLIWDVVQM